MTSRIDHISLSVKETFLRKQVKAYLLNLVGKFQQWTSQQIILQSSTQYTFPEQGKNGEAEHNYSACANQSRQCSAAQRFYPSPLTHSLVESLQTTSEVHQAFSELKGKARNSNNAK